MCYEVFLMYELKLSGPIFLGYDPFRRQALMTGTELVSETSVMFSQVTQLIAREHYTDVVVLLSRMFSVGI
jgi:hypothetical protein